MLKLFVTKINIGKLDTALRNLMGITDYTHLNIFYRKKTHKLH